MTTGSVAPSQQLKVDLPGFTWLRPVVQRLNQFLRNGTRVSASLVLASIAGGGIAFASAPDGTTQGTKALLASLARSESAGATTARHKAQDALEQEAQARKRGRARDGELLAAQAREWAEVGTDLLRAARLEQQASQLEKQGQNGKQAIQRARILVEETTARKGRASAALKKHQAAQDSNTPASTGDHP